MDRTATYYDLLDAFEQEGCPVCRLALTAVHHYLDSINYDSVNDPGFQHEIRSSLGFCNEHAYQWLRQAHVLGTALIYREILKTLTAGLRDVRYHKPPLLGGLLDHGANHADQEIDALAPAGICPACRLLADEEQTALKTLLESSDEPEFRETYGQSADLCLPHVTMALRSAPDRASFAVIRDVALAQQDRLTEQLGEVIRKHDYRFRDEPIGEEKGAVQRAVHHVAGEHAVDRLRNRA